MPLYISDMIKQIKQSGFNKDGYVNILGENGYDYPVFAVFANEYGSIVLVSYEQYSDGTYDIKKMVGYKYLYDQRFEKGYTLLAKQRMFANEGIKLDKKGFIRPIDYIEPDENPNRLKMIECFGIDYVLNLERQLGHFIE